MKFLLSTLTTLTLASPALAQTPPEVPAVPRAKPAGEVPVRSLMSPQASVAKIEKLRTHLEGLVNTRADRLGGPRFADQDARLQILHAMLKVATAQPALPIPEYVAKARRLEDIWGASTATFVHELMVKTTTVRPDAPKPGPEQCKAVCGRLAEVSGKDTATGVEERGWPMDDEARRAVMAAAHFAEDRCLSHCMESGVHNPACVMKLESQEGLMQCWKAPAPQ